MEQADDIGRTLRAAREKRGRSVAEIAYSLGMPAAHVGALESGQVDHFASQLIALTALRQYADALHLDGDALALVMLDSWSVDDSAAYRRPEAPRDAAHARKLRDATLTTAEIPIVADAPRQDGKAGRAARKRPHARHGQDSRGPRVPIQLRVVVWACGVLVVAGLIGIGLEQAHPSWFNPLRAPTTVPTTVPSSAPNATTTTASSPFHLVGTTSDSATYRIAESSFNVTLNATGDCWVEVTNGGLSPLYLGTLHAGMSYTAQDQSNVEIQLGSSSVSVVVSTGPKAASATIGTLTMPTSPYKFTLQGS